MERDKKEKPKEAGGWGGVDGGGAPPIQGCSELESVARPGIIEMREKSVKEIPPQSIEWMKESISDKVVKIYDGLVDSRVFQCFGIKFRGEDETVDTTKISSR